MILSFNGNVQCTLEMRKLLRTIPTSDFTCLYLSDVRRMSMAFFKRLMRAIQRSKISNIVFHNTYIPKPRQVAKFLLSTYLTNLYFINVYNTEAEIDEFILHPGFKHVETFHLTMRESKYNSYALANVLRFTNMRSLRIVTDIQSDNIISQIKYCRWIVVVDINNVDKSRIQREIKRWRWMYIITSTVIEWFKLFVYVK